MILAQTQSNNKTNNRTSFDETQWQSWAQATVRNALSRDRIFFTHWVGTRIQTTARSSSIGSTKWAKNQDQICLDELHLFFRRRCSSVSCKTINTQKITCFDQICVRHTENVTGNMHNVHCTFRRKNSKMLDIIYRSLACALIALLVFFVAH